MTNIKVIHWFRQDLRLSDNPSLHHASKNDHVLPVYILDNENSGEIFQWEEQAVFGCIILKKP